MTMQQCGTWHPCPNVAPMELPVENPIHAMRIEVLGVTGAYARICQAIAICASQPMAKASVRTHAIRKV